MKLINPNYQPPAGPLEDYRVQIETWFTNNTGTRAVTFDQLRTFFGRSREQWPDGAIHQQLNDWGFTVEAD